jgi:hypothetical protein
MRRGEAGASAVEFAIILPLLVVLIFGTLYGGLLLNRNLSVTQAAREGARFGATRDLEATPPSLTPAPTWFAEVRARTLAASAGTVAAGDRVCVWFVAANNSTIPDGANSGLGCPSSPPGALPADSSDRVVVYVEQPGTVELVLYAFPTTLRARAVARHEGGLQP